MAAHFISTCTGGRGENRYLVRIIKERIICFDLRCRKEIFNLNVSAIRVILKLRKESNYKFLAQTIFGDKTLIRFRKVRKEDFEQRCYDNNLAFGDKAVFWQVNLFQDENQNWRDE